MVKIKFATSLLLLCFITVSIANSQPKTYFPDYDYDTLYNDTVTVNSTPSIQMYFYIKQYAEIYGIPEPYAFALAYQETRYEGPLDLDYNHKKTSSAGALGPMQVMPSTANLIYGQSVSKFKLMTDIKFNVKISMMILRRLYDQYNNWGMAFGAYNTGRPCVNGYAKKILSGRYIWAEISA
jgi:soluble lytic murein transglycosylase-like protein